MNGRKTCPMCGAGVDPRTTTCGACGDSRLARSIGRVRVRLNSELPAICALCGEQATQRIPTRFRQTRENLGRAVNLPVCHRHRFFSPLALATPVQTTLFLTILIL